MGTERISAKNDTALLLGRFPATLLASPSEMPNLNVQDIRNQSNETVDTAEAEIVNVHDLLDVQAPPMNSIVETDKANYSHTGPLDYYYFHPDHLAHGFLFLLVFAEPPSSVWEVRAISLI